MCHNQRTDQAGTYAPAGSPYIFLFIFFGQEFYIKRFRKILTQKMRSTGLQGFAVLHQGFNAIGINRTGKTFILGFNPFYNR